MHLVSSKRRELHAVSDLAGQRLVQVLRSQAAHVSAIDRNYFVVRSQPGAIRREPFGHVAHEQTSIGLLTEDGADRPLAWRTTGSPAHEQEHAELDPTPGGRGAPPGVRQLTSGSPH